MSWRGRGHRSGGRGSHSTFSSSSSPAARVDSSNVDVQMKGISKNVTLAITGFAIPLDSQALLTFLQSSAHKPITFKEFSYDAVCNTFYIIFDNFSNANSVLQLSGIRFNRAKLNIMQMTEKTFALKESLKSLCISRLSSSLSGSPEDNSGGHQRVLNLDAIVDINPGAAVTEKFDFSSRNFTILLFEIIAAIKPTTLSLAKNRISSLKSLSTLNENENITSLNLEGNLISIPTDPNVTLHFKIPGVKNLIIANNPISSSPSSIVLPYLRQVFPSLSSLNGKELPVTYPDLKSMYSATKPNFFDNPSTASTASAFISRFFHEYDNIRQQLSVLYEDFSVFSMSALRKDVSIQSIYPHSHNLHLHHPSPQQHQQQHHQHQTISDSVFTSTASIASALASLPKTSTHIDSLTVDGWQQPYAHTLLLFISGIFTEPSKDLSSPHSFSRAFTLYPAPAGSRAALAGWPVIIANDCLTIYSYSVKEKADEIMKKCGVGKEFALICLKDNAWNVYEATKAINLVKRAGKLPKEAFT